MNRQAAKVAVLRPVKHRESLPPTPLTLTQCIPTGDPGKSPVTPTNDTKTSLIPGQLISSKRLSEPLSFLEFDRIYSDHYPLKIEVIKGYRGTTPEMSFSTGDVYHIHFKQYRDIVIVQDETGHKYSIPIDSDVRLGLVYPTQHLDGTCTTFSRVSDILACESPPKVVGILKCWRKGDTSVDKGEILAIRRKYRKALEVFSCSTKMVKTLPGSCRGSFTTDPFVTSMYIGDIMEYVPNVLNTKAKVYIDSTQTGETTRVPRLEIVTLLEKKEEVSLIASACNVHNVTKDSQHTILNIPLDACFAAMEVAVIECSKAIYENTQSIMENFDTIECKTIKDLGSTQAYRTQSFLYDRIHSISSTRYGVRLVKPKSLTSVGVAMPLCTENDMFSHGYCSEYPLSFPNTATPGPLSSDYTEVSPPQVENTPVLDTYVEIGEDSLDTGKDSELESLRTEVQKLRKTIAAMSSSTVSKRDHQQVEENIHTLCTLSNGQVLDMLDGMGLPMYKGTFSNFGVNGEVLVEMNDKTLETFLHITSKLHRIRLMKIITGKKSAMEFLTQ